MFFTKTALSFVYYFIFVQKKLSNFLFIIFLTIFEKGESSEIGLQFSTACFEPDLCIGITFAILS